VRRAGRWIVAIAAVLAVAVLATELAAETRLYSALTKAAGTAGATMVVAALAHRLWAGARLAGAQLPGGVGVELEHGADDAASLERRLALLRATTNRRLRRLEREVFGANGGGGNIR
jgi:hypothetical protein